MLEELQQIARMGSVYSLACLAGACGPDSVTMQGSDGGSGVTSTPATESADSSSEDVSAEDPCAGGTVASEAYCLFPIPDLFSHTAGIAVDSNADGRDELILGVDAFQREADGTYREEYAACEGAEGCYGWYDVDTGGVQFRQAIAAGTPVRGTPLLNDYDEDGVDDVLFVSVLGQSFEVITMGQGQLPPKQSVRIEGIEGLGDTVPVDVDGDGRLEFVVSETETSSVHLRRREGEAFVRVEGSEQPMPGCGDVGEWATGDFNRDGSDDAVLLGVFQVCDHYPLEYDPEFHAAAVVLGDKEAGTLRAGPEPLLPTGAVAQRLAAADVDYDGNLDVVFFYSTERFGVARSRGDGSFEDVVVIDTSDGKRPTNAPASSGSIIDIDRDGAAEFLVADQSGGIALMSDPLGSWTLAAFDLQGVEGAGVAAHGDFNADGVTDFVMRTPTPEGELGHRAGVVLSRP